MNKEILPEILDDSKTASKNNNFLNQPQNLFLLTGVLVLIIPIFFWGQSVVIHIDKPRIFISGECFIYVVSGLLILGWMIYMLTHSMLATQFLSWVHVGITLGALLFFLLTSSWFFKLYGSSNLQSLFIRTLLERVREFYSAIGAIRCKIIVKFAKMIHVSEDNVEYS